MSGDIPYDNWAPLSVAEVSALFTDAPFRWALAGGYAVEQFLGASIREHSDIDVVVFRDEQPQLQRWMAGWELFAADPPSSLRRWKTGEFLPYGTHDIWGHRAGLNVWQLQIMLAEVEGEEWFSRRNSQVRGKRDDLIATYNGVPCIRIEVQLLYKAKNHRPKDDLDFESCVPALDPLARKWLRDHLHRLYPEGHRWSEFLNPRIPLV